MRISPKKIIVTGFLLTAVLLINSAGRIFADASNGNREINFLLKEIRQSDCVFFRNGKTYGGQEAFDHVEKKYHYYQKKIATTEDFIDYCATKSILSGKDYQVQCPGEEKRSFSEMLFELLEKYRSQAEAEATDH